VVALVDSQEPDLELDAADGFVDVVREARVENRVVVAAHLVRFLRRDRDVSQPGLSGDETAGNAHVQWRVTGAGAREDLLHQAVGAGEPREALDTAQRRLFSRPLGDRHAAPDDPVEDFVECVVVVEFPAERGDVLGGPALQQEAALVVVEPETHEVGQHLVEVHADGVAAKTAPLAELAGLDDDVAEVDAAENIRHGRASSRIRGTR
jgi:hypothetical protein